MSSKNTKTTLNNEQRMAVIASKDQNPNFTNLDLVDWVKKRFNLDVHPSTISRLMKRKEDIGVNFSAKRQRSVQYPDIENTLLEWILRSQDKITLTDAILVEKAKNFAQMLNISDDNIKFSNGWLSKFKKRHNLAQIKKHGEDASADHAIATAAIPQLREVLKEYDLRDIYNMDETGLFYRYKYNYIIPNNIKLY
ncbi:2937_t:CDS:1 [Ambispora gerdemannii]|uniref:2937_t:CDS:1 n=1 Tax=Ambispora gerdemannii TaxID=144530 RepID=A0A9N9EDI2_9GLOM|nr:2937_t:CDS:1 [Ambispora gerdemannii]